MTRRQVHFHPVNKKTIREAMIQGLIIHSTIAGFATAYALVPTLIIAALLGLSAEFLFLVGGSSTLIVGLLASVPYLLHMRQREWRHNEYPQYNAKLMRMMRWLAWRKDHRGRYLRIERDAMIGRQYIIPSFENVMLEYRTTGDFSKQLRRIKVTNLLNNQELYDDWFAVFTFTKRPQNGALYVRYL